MSGQKLFSFNADSSRMDLEQFIAIVEQFHCPDIPRYQPLSSFKSMKPEAKDRVFTLKRKWFPMTKNAELLYCNCPRSNCHFRKRVYRATSHSYAYKMQSQISLGGKQNCVTGTRLNLLSFKRYIVSSTRIPCCGFSYHISIYDISLGYKLSYILDA